VKLSLSDREFMCRLCGSWFDRDVASALVILKEGLCLCIAGEKTRDGNASAMTKHLSYIPRVSVSMSWEALSVRSGYPCELLINLSTMLFLYVSVSIVTMMLFRTMSFSIFSHGL